MQSHSASERSAVQAANACLSVLMPIYNEIDTLRAIVFAVLAQPIVGELIAVDDGSSDGSRELLAELAKEDRRIRAFFHEANRGKGAALRTAENAREEISHASGSSCKRGKGILSSRPDAGSRRKAERPLHPSVNGWSHLSERILRIRF